MAIQVVNQSSTIGAEVVSVCRPRVITNLYDTDDSLTNVKFFATLGVNDSDDEALLSFVAANVMLPRRVDVGLPRYSSVSAGYTVPAAL